MSLVILAAAALLGSLFPSYPAHVTIVIFGALAAFIVHTTCTLFTKRGARSAVSRATLVFALCTCVVSALRADRAIAAHERARSEILATHRGTARCVVYGTIRGSPIVTSGMARAAIEASRVACDDRPERLNVRVVVSFEPRDLRRGDEVEIVAELGVPERHTTRELGDPRPLYARRGILLSGTALDVVLIRRSWSLFGSIDAARYHVRSRIDATMTRDAAPFARALVLGETDLSEADADAIRRSGLSHLLAVSGMHLVLVASGFARALRALLVRFAFFAAARDVRKIASLVAIPIAWIYSDFAGGSGSAERAAWMLTAMLGVRAAGRRPDSLRAFALSSLAMSITSPLAASDLSFILSVAATAGLLAFARPMTARLQSITPPFLHPIATLLATTSAATLTCTPLILRMSDELSPVGLFTNVIAVPLGELIALPVCMVHAISSPCPPLESGAAWLASFALSLVARLAHVGAAIPFFASRVPLPTESQIALTYLLLALCKFEHRWRARLIAICTLVIALLEFHARASGRPRNELRVTFIDVGQGDSILVDLPDGTAFLVDAGGTMGRGPDPGEQIVWPLLRARRRTELRFVMLSHPHPDHFGGVAAILRHVDVAAFVTTGEQVESPDYAALLGDATRRHVPILHAKNVCGVHEIAGVTIDVRAPCPATDEALSTNDNSFIVRLSYLGRLVLLVGDAERASEERLIRSLTRSSETNEIARTQPWIERPIDILKVGHHGSATSSSEPFIASLRPRHAIISCGTRNRFGHPRSETLETLGAHHVSTWRTDRDGSITAVIDARGVSIRTSSFASPSHRFIPQIP